MGAAVACFALVTALLSWPQAIRLSCVPDHYDPLLSMWRLAWIAYQLPRDPRHLFDANIFWPEPNTLAYSDATLLQGLLAAPAIWLGVPVPVIYNLLVLSSFVFAATAAFVLARSVTGNWSGAMIAGIVFGFTAYRWDHYVHLELLWSGWMPLVLLALHRTLQSGRLRDGLAVGALFVAQAWSSIYYGVLFAAVLAFTAPVMAWSSALGVRRRVALALGLGALMAATLLLPYLQPYRAARTSLGARSGSETAWYSAGPRHYLSSTPGSVLYGNHTAAWGRHEKHLFPGVIAVGLAVFALWPPLNRRHLAFLAGLVVAIDLSAGTGGILFPVLREHVMPFRGLRAPARAAHIALLFLGLLAACGWARLERRLSSPRARRLAAALAIAMALAEHVQWPQPLRPVALEAPPVYAWLASAPAGAVVELPFPPDNAPHLRNPEFQFHSTFHWQPIVNGYSGNFPESYFRTASALKSFPSGEAMTRLRAIGVRHVVLHEAGWGGRPFHDLVRVLADSQAFTLRASFGEPGSEVRVYEVDGADQ